MVTAEFWDAWIRRAEELGSKNSATKELLIFYGKLLQVQKEIYEFLNTQRNWLPSGSLADDLPMVRPAFPMLLRTVAAAGPPTLAQEALRLSHATNGIIEELLLNHWRSPSDVQFFAKAFLQPYARWLAKSGGRPVDRTFDNQENRCPFCGGLPQLSYLQIREASAESGNRDLICATCLTTWSFRRVVCASCLEERPFKLGYFRTQLNAHVRVEACDTCKRYIKGIDLTLFGLAIPIVDDVASAALDVWAQEHGYSKIELNLVGL
jgi:formate dehydrogenase maturation protein FdhE